MSLRREEGHIGRFTVSDCIRLCTLLSAVHPEIIEAVRERRLWQ